MPYPITLVPNAGAPVKVHNRKQRNRWEKRFKQQKISYQVVHPILPAVVFKSSQMGRKYPVLVVGTRPLGFYDTPIAKLKPEQRVCKNHKELHAYVRSLKHQGFLIEEKEGYEGDI